MLARIALIIALLFPVVAVEGVAIAQPIDAGIALDAGSASATASTPADKLHDPTKAPQATIDDVTQAKRQGWAALAFAIGVIAARLLGRAKSIPWLAFLNKGRTSVLVGAFAALVTAGYNAIADGGSPFAGMYAGVLACAAWWQSHSGDAG